MNFELYEYKIEELGKVITGKTPPSKISDAFSAQGIPFVTPKDMDGRRLIDKTERYLSSQGIEAVRNCLLPQNSIAVSCIGSDMGKVVLLPGESITNQQINSIIVDSKRFDYKYVYYYLSTLQDELKAIAGGSATPILNKGHFSQFKVSLPIRPVQNKISLILDSLDAKIEVNTKINQTLEQMAQALFKSWFVDFEPVKAKIVVLEAGDSQENATLAAMTAISGKNSDALAVFECEHPEQYAELKATAELFPSAMQVSEIGDIPEGWCTNSIKNICDVVDYVANGSFAALKENVNLYDTPNDVLYVRTTDFNKGFSTNLKYTDNESYNFLKKSSLVGNEVIISNVGDVGTVFRPPSWLGMPMTLASNAIAIKSDKLNEFLCLYFKSNIGQHAISSIVTGSAQLKFNKTSFRALKLVLPTDEILNSFNKITIINTKMLNGLNANTYSLTQLRDTLLPKLLSGEIPLPDVEQAVSEAENV